VPRIFPSIRALPPSVIVYLASSLMYTPASSSVEILSMILPPNMLNVKEGLLTILSATPPPSRDVLFLIIPSLIVTVAVANAYIPPPLLFAELSDIVPPFIVKIPWLT